MPEAMQKAAPGHRGEGRAPRRPAHAEAVERYLTTNGGIERLRHPARSEGDLARAPPRAARPRVGERGECALRGGALPGCAPEVPRGAGRRARVAGDPLQRRETPRVRGLGGSRSPRGLSRPNSGRAPTESRSARRAHTLARLHEKRAPYRRCTMRKARAQSAFVVLSLLAAACAADPRRSGSASSTSSAPPGSRFSSATGPSTTTTPRSSTARPRPAGSSGSSRLDTWTASGSSRAGALR